MDKPFEFTAGDLSLDFVNTLDNRPLEHPTERLVSYDALIAWAEQGGAVSKSHAEALRRLAKKAPQEAARHLESAVVLREALNEIYEAAMQGRDAAESEMAVLNRSLQAAAMNSRLARRGSNFVWEWREPEKSLQSIEWVLARAAEKLLTSEDLVNVRNCADDTCRWLFVDRTKNHGRRWCEMRVCGNRDKARRHYQRTKHSAKAVDTKTTAK